MAVSWNPAVPPASPPDLSNLDYSVWKFRQKAGVSQQDSDYEGCLDDAEVKDLLYGFVVTFSSVNYYQPLDALAFFIESDPEQRLQSMEGDAMDQWTDPYKRTAALRKEQEQLNRQFIPDYGVQSAQYFGPTLTAWGDE